MDLSLREVRIRSIYFCAVLFGTENSQSREFISSFASDQLQQNWMKFMRWLGYSKRCFEAFELSTRLVASIGSSKSSSVTTESG